MPKRNIIAGVITLVTAMFCAIKIQPMKGHCIDLNQWLSEIEVNLVAQCLVGLVPGFCWAYGRASCHFMYVQCGKEQKDFDAFCVSDTLLFFALACILVVSLFQNARRGLVRPSMAVRAILLLALVPLLNGESTSASLSMHSQTCTLPPSTFLMLIMLCCYQGLICLTVVSWHLSS